MGLSAGKIYLTDIMSIEHADQYKVHLAVRNDDGQEPLDTFVQDRKSWKGWNSYRGNKNRFNKTYIFSMMDYYPQKDIWLFGGVFEVLKRHSDSYEIELTDQFKPMIGKLKIHFPYKSRTRALVLNRHIQNMSVHEILPKMYDGEAFRGFENIRLSFNELQNIIHKQRIDWKTALENVSGIYLIVDKSNGKKYVGSAYGSEGLWSRWAQYVKSGHGSNKDLKNLITYNGVDHARNNFQFSLLEYMPASTSKDVVINRESHWKKVLLSGEYGYNLN
ncbi:GIY-YIG nuclease family protein [Rhodohalobacter sp. SW132]|uniref:GIY-YIG nuclease family protein n=1 Tax=Rhodohalobacter sp. SW132 TaxID=2293433 RepID=UPI000E24E0D7|nr:GIY-YIG nuclease family protein [Rhodohalobacter sp. SW132]REL32987.1 GIY-YIG nuclease family protein [Rhodohalobacter sp. SW132]